MLEPIPAGEDLMDTGILNDTDTTTLLGKPCNVILFNDDEHSMAEVSRQIIKAIHCGIEKAMNIMLEAHSTGRAIVFTGNRERCELVESILSEIQLRTQIESA
jgi:ATP-dependent Clp protease adapter protein ClpS